MVIKIRCSDAIGKLVMGFFALLETVAGDYKAEDLEFEVGDDPVERAGGGARIKYWAKLPLLSDGAFDMDAVDKTVKENLHSLGPATVKGIVYNDIVQLTLKGEIVTEPKLRAARQMKAGTSQREVGQLVRMGLIEKGPINMNDPEEASKA